MKAKENQNTFNRPDVARAGLITILSLIHLVTHRPGKVHFFYMTKLLPKIDLSTKKVCRREKPTLSTASDRSTERK